MNMGSSNMCREMAFSALVVCAAVFIGPFVADAEADLFLTDPHRAVIVEGDDYPTVNILVERDGDIRGQVVQLDSRVYGEIDGSFGSRTVVQLPVFRVQGNRRERMVVEGKPPGPGRYEFQLSHQGGGNQTLGFTVIEAGQANKGVRMDRHGICYRDGEPWLPMVVYTNSAARKNGGSGSEPLDSARDQFLDYFEGTPFAMMDYATPRAGLNYAVDYMNRCAQRGIAMSMHAAPTVIDSGEAKRYAEQLRDHPALVFWYTNDELSNSWYDRLRDMQETLVLHDPFHPTHVQHADMDKLLEQVGTYDIYVHQFYTGGERQIRQNFGHMITLTGIIPPTIPFWGNMLLHDNKLRTMSYGCIANGATGLMYYAFHVMRDRIDNWTTFNRRWDEIVQMGREIESRQHLLMQPPTPVQATANVDELALRTVSGKHGTWLLIVNPYWETRDVKIALPVATESAVDINGRAYPVRGSELQMHITPEDVWLIQLNTPPEKTSPDFNSDGIVNFLDFTKLVEGIELSK